MTGVFWDQSAGDRPAAASLTNRCSPDISSRGGLRSAAVRPALGLRPPVGVLGLIWLVERFQCLMRIGPEGIEHASVVDQDPVDMHLETAERVVVAGVEV